MTAAEVEVETAALYHAELWYDLLNIQDNCEDNYQDENNKKDDNLK